MSRRKYDFLKMKPGQEVWFGDYEEPEEDFGKIIYPEEIIGKTCGECVRCEKRDHAYMETAAEGYHCSMQSYSVDIQPTDKACVRYWDKAEHERIENAQEEAKEKRREELWAIYAKREPIKLPIIHDGCGLIPECPICGEMPYSTEQCHWCGQRFIQDKEIEEYNKPKGGTMDCWNCGGKDTIEYKVSKYNGHRRGRCKNCGLTFME